MCGAVAFPSLLHSRPSIDDFHLLAQETNYVPSDFIAGVERSPWETKASQLSQPPPKVPFTVATPFYLPPSLRNAELTRLQPHDFAAPALPRTALEPQLPSPINGKYSPASEFSLEGSTTSSVYGDPFHWDTVLAGLPPSPQRSPALAVRLSTSASPVPSIVQCHPVDAQRDSICFGSATSPGVIPTIVVLNPDSVMVPTQASVSSIIGLYVGRGDSAQTFAGEMPILELQPPEESEQELDEDDTDGEGSSSGSEFEIVAVPALKVRLDTILETDELDAGNAFGSLMVRCIPCHHSSA